MRRVSSRSLLFCLIVVVSLIFSAKVKAQTLNDSLNITTSPLPISVTMKPGETKTIDLRIKNNGREPEDLRVRLMKFSAYGDEGKPYLEEREEGDEYFDWVSFSTPDFRAEPNQWNSVAMTLTVPQEAAFGYYFAVVFERGKASESLLPGLTDIRGGSATLVLLNVDVPGAKREVSLESFRADKKSYEFLPVSFTATLKNTGNVHVVPRGTIYIYKGGDLIDTLPINENSGNVLPDSQRQFTKEWSKGFPVYKAKEQGGAVVLDSNGKARAGLNWQISDAKNLRFGKYRAVLTAVYDDGAKDIPLESSLEFWVVPWRLLFVVVGIPLVMVVLLVYLFWSRRRFKRRVTGVQSWRR